MSANGGREYEPPQIAELMKLRHLTTDDLEAIIRAPERLRALALDLEARALQAVHEGKFEAATKTIELARAYVQLAEAWVPRPVPEIRDPYDPR